MHSVSSYRGKRPTNTPTNEPTNRHTVQWCGCSVGVVYCRGRGCGGGGGASSSSNSTQPMTNSAYCTVLSLSDASDAQSPPPSRLAGWSHIACGPNRQVLPAGRRWLVAVTILWISIWRAVPCRRHHSAPTSFLSVILVQLKLSWLCGDEAFYRCALHHDEFCEKCDFFTVKQFWDRKFDSHRNCVNQCSAL